MISLRWESVSSDLEAKASRGPKPWSPSPTLSISSLDIGVEALNCEFQAGTLGPAKPQVDHLKLKPSSHSLKLIIVSLGRGAKASNGTLRALVNNL